VSTLINIAAAALVSSFLVGCGKKMPDCSAPEVTALLEQLAKNSIDKEAEEVGKKLSIWLNGIAAVKIVGSLQSHKLDGFTTLSKNKDNGLVTCKAIRSGSYNITSQFSPVSGLSLFVVGVGLQQLPFEDRKALGDIDKKNTDGSKVTYVKNHPANSTITYTANYTDKGDQIYVQIINMSE